MGDRGGVAPQSPETDARKAPVQRLAKSVFTNSVVCGRSPKLLLLAVGKARVQE